MPKNNVLVVSILLIIIVGVAFFSLGVYSGNNVTGNPILNLFNKKPTLVDTSKLSEIKFNSSGNVYVGSNCNNIDGDSDYDGIQDNDDQCRFTPFAMSILDFDNTDSEKDYMLWQGAKITLNGVNVIWGETFANLSIQRMRWSNRSRGYVLVGAPMTAELGQDTPVSLGRVIPNLTGTLYLTDFRYISSAGVGTKGYVAIMSTSSVNMTRITRVNNITGVNITEVTIDTGCATIDQRTS